MGRWTTAAGPMVALQAVLVPVRLSVDIVDGRSARDYVCEGETYRVSVAYSVERPVASLTLDIYHDAELVEAIPERADRRLGRGIEVQLDGVAHEKRRPRRPTGR